MSQPGAIAAALRTALPSHLHAQIPALAQMLADALAGRRPTLSNWALLQELHSLQDTNLRLCDGQDGKITVGPIMDQSIAVSYQPTFQTQEATGDHTAQAINGRIELAMHVQFIERVAHGDWYFVGPMIGVIVLVSVLLSVFYGLIKFDLYNHFILILAWVAWAASAGMLALVAWLLIETRQLAQRNTRPQNQLGSAQVGRGARPSAVGNSPRNELVAFLARLPVFSDDTQRQALLRHAGLDWVSFESTPNLAPTIYVDRLLSRLQGAGGGGYLQPLFDAVAQRAHLGGDKLDEFNQLQQAYLIVGEAPPPLEQQRHLWLWRVFVFVPGLLLLLLVGEFSREAFSPTAEEFCLVPMTGHVNVLIADFDQTPDGRTLADDTEGPLDNEFSAHENQPDVAFHRHRYIPDGNQARGVADCMNAHIIIWATATGGEEKSYTPRFVIRDPVEGGLEVTGHFDTPPPADSWREKTSERIRILVVFTAGLIHLFSAPEHEESEHADDAVNKFDRAILLLTSLRESEGESLDIPAQSQQDGTVPIECTEEDIERIEDGVADTFYFFRGRAQAAAGDQDAALQDYATTLQINCAYTWAYLGRGAAYYYRGTSENPSEPNAMIAARDEFLRALEIQSNPLRPELLPRRTAYIKGKAYVNLGNVYTIWAEESAADEHFEENVKNARDHYEKAIQAYRHYQDTKKEDQPDVPTRYYAAAHRSLGWLAHMEWARLNRPGAIDTAEEHYQHCIDQTPSDPRATQLHKDCKQFLKDLRQASE